MADNITIETENLVTKKEEHTSMLMYGLTAEIPCLIMYINLIVR
jgi:hypothetical protein